ncbi:MAG: hypothetical protein LBT00_07380 [Spirochaetaceae bacterium]|nr:hypothetical protein [Spirochaetaceae bacterium]
MFVLFLAKLFHGPSLANLAHPIEDQRLPMVAILPFNEVVKDYSPHTIILTYGCSNVKEKGVVLAPNSTEKSARTTLNSREKGATYTPFLHEKRVKITPNSREKGAEIALNFKEKGGKLNAP